MKSVIKLREEQEDLTFDLEFESQMVQSRMVSTILTAVDNKKITQKDLANRTGLSQSSISALFHSRKKLNMEHVAKFQNALGIKLQAPTYLTDREYKQNYINEGF